MARAKVLGGSGTRLNVWIDTDADRMLHEMLDAWYPGYTRVQGAVVTRAIKLLYRQFQREQLCALRQHAGAQGRLQRGGQKAPRLEPGDEWPSPLADFSPLYRNTPGAPCQLHRVWAFRGKSLPRVKARAYLGRGAQHHSRKREAQLAGASVPHKHLVQPKGWPLWSQQRCHRSRLRPGSAGGWAT
jgi:hypothetical protein